MPDVDPPAPEKRSTITSFWGAIVDGWPLGMSGFLEQLVGREKQCNRTHPGLDVGRVKHVTGTLGDTVEPGHGGALLPREGGREGMAAEV